MQPLLSFASSLLMLMCFGGLFARSAFVPSAADATKRRPRAAEDAGSGTDKKR
jgi:hypothetical protein